MRFFTYFYDDEIEQLFYQKPQNFNKYSNSELLSYGLGATLYMPATRLNIHQDILSKKHVGLTSLVIDLEDAVGDNEVGAAEKLLIKELLKLHGELIKQFLSIEDFPLMFIRIRNLEQLKRVIEQLGDACQLLTGAVLPKFSADSGKELLREIKSIHTDEHPFYAMPILESSRIIHKETRIDELMKIKRLLDEYRDNILNVRIGATDFSGLYGIRRNIDTTVYDIVVLRDCIGDIINVFQRSSCPYVISGPVWEYFKTDNLEGFIREIRMDIANGLTGKTIIHPSHIKGVQALNVVSFEQYIDACNIVNAATGDLGVMKSDFSNKMNEIKPHYYWARKVILKSQLYGVLNDEFTNIDIIQKEVYA